MSQDKIYEWIKKQPHNIAWSARAISEGLRQEGFELGTNCCRRNCNSLVKFKYLAFLTNKPANEFQWKRFYVLYEYKDIDVKKFVDSYGVLKPLHIL